MTKSRQILFIVLALTCINESRPTRANSFEWIAFYEPIEPGHEQLKVPIATGATEKPLLLPRLTLTHRLAAFGVRFRKGSLLPGDLAAIDRFDFAAQLNEGHFSNAHFDKPQLPPSTAVSGEEQILKVSTLTSTRMLDTVTLKARARYKSQYLCQLERYILETEGTNFTQSAGDERSDFLAAIVQPAPNSLKRITDATEAVNKAGQAVKKAERELAAAKPAKLAELRLTLELAKKDLAATEQALSAIKTSVMSPYARILLDKKYRKPILFSFCHDRLNLINWSSVAKAAASGHQAQLLGFPGIDLVSSEDGQRALKLAHKMALADILVDRMHTLGFGRSADVSAFAPSNNHFAEPEVGVDFKITFQLVGDLSGALLPAERSGTDFFEPMGDVVDVDSTIYVKIPDILRSATPSVCDTLLGHQLEVVLVSDDLAGNRVAAPIPFRATTPPNGTAPSESVGDGCKRALKVSLKTYEDRVVQFRIGFKLPGLRDALLLSSYDARVKNIGLITTAPLVTEIVSLVTSPSSYSDDRNSSLSLALAHRSGDTRLAVTFPWTFGFSSRSIPNLAKIINLHAHLTILLDVSSTSSDSAASLTAGVGVSLFERVFQFSWAHGLSGAEAVEGRNYLVVGVSIPDIAELIFDRH